MCYEKKKSIPKCNPIKKLKARFKKKYIKVFMHTDRPELKMTARSKFLSLVSGLDCPRISILACLCGEMRQLRDVFAAKRRSIVLRPAVALFLLPWPDLYLSSCAARREMFCPDLSAPHRAALNLAPAVCVAAYSAAYPSSRKQLSSFKKRPFSFSFTLRPLFVCPYRFDNIV